MPIANPNKETAASIGALINGATTKTTPVDADSLIISDSAASGTGKKVSLTNFALNYLKSIFDSIYATISDLALKANNADAALTGTPTVNGSDILVNSANITIGSGSPNVAISDTTGTATLFASSDAKFEADGIASTITITAANGATLNGSPIVIANKTIDTSATPTINTTFGIVRIAAGNSTVTVTSINVTANSGVNATVRTVDATLKSVSAQMGSGSFILTGLAAATANTDIWIQITI